MRDRNAPRPLSCEDRVTDDRRGSADDIGANEFKAVPIADDSVPELDRSAARPARHLLRAALATQEQHDARAKSVDDARARGVIVLDPDLAEAFLTENTVNDGLRELLPRRAAELKQCRPAGRADAPTIFDRPVAGNVSTFRLSARPRHPTSPAGPPDRHCATVASHPLRLLKRTVQSLPVFAAMRDAITAFGENVPVLAKSV